VVDHIQNTILKQPVDMRNKKITAAQEKKQSIENYLSIIKKRHLQISKAAIKYMARLLKAI